MGVIAVLAAFVLAPLIGLSLAVAGGVALRKRGKQGYASTEERSLKIDEARTVFKFGLFFLLAPPVAFGVAWLVSIAGDY